MGARVELSFIGVSSADAGYLAQELELSLLKAGVPSNALALKRASSEAMDFGTILGVSVDAILHAIGAAGYIACFAKCVHDVVSKHGVTVRFSTPDGSVEISGPEASREAIQRVLTKLQKTKTAPRRRAKPKAKPRHA